MSKEEPSAKEKQVSEAATVLHGQQRKLASIEAEVSDVEAIGQDNRKSIDRLLAQAGDLCQEAGLAMPDREVVPILSESNDVDSVTTIPAWDDMLAEYDIAGPQLPLDDLLTVEQCEDIRARFNAPLQREPWNKGDLAAVFGAALVGIVADFFCAPIGNPLAKALENYGMRNPANHGSHYVYDSFKRVQGLLRGSALANRIPWLEKVANVQVTHDNLPIDYSGTHFGGAHHRVLSGCHDLLRFLSGIWQIKNGQFIGVRYEHGTAIMEAVSSQRGSSSPFSTQPDWTTAAILYFLHVLADFFTTTSLPIPGTTLLRELPNRDLRKFIAQSYQGGFNLRHVVGQAVTPTVTSLILILYNMLRYRIPNWYKKHVKKEEVQDEAVRGLKMNEMMAVAHTLVMGVNVGRVVITGNWFSLNLAESLYCAKILLGLAMKTRKRHCIVEKCKRNRIYLDEGWASLESYIGSPIEPSEIVWPSKAIAVT